MLEVIQGIALDLFGIDEEDVMMSTDLKGDLGLDMVDVAGIAGRLNDYFGFNCDGVWGEWCTVQDIVDTWKKQEAGE